MYSITIILNDEFYDLTKEEITSRFNVDYLNECIVHNGCVVHDSGYIIGNVYVEREFYQKLLELKDFRITCTSLCFYREDGFIYTHTFDNLDVRLKEPLLLKVVIPT